MDANANRQLVKIIGELCAERGIPLRRYADDWILELAPGGKSVFIVGYQFPHNDAAAQLLCEDKSALSDILRAHGVSAVEHWFFLTPDNLGYLGRAGNWRRMTELLETHKTLVCKSNTGSGGRDVFRVSTQAELENAAAQVFRNNRALALSPFYEIESEYRVVLLRGSAELVYQKERPFVEGDGGHTFAELYAQKYGFPASDAALETHPGAILPAGRRVRTHWKHNLGQGAAPRPVADGPLRQDLIALALAAAAAVGAVFASVDIVETEKGLKVLEINSGVMMEHFAASSAENYRTAKEIYRRALDGRG
ncbi:MAG: hypothetical protein LBT60_02845 [Oscillospiraceae bacterium]|jgi:glutathione synthase/RimK-type ligase-like ATP-grasp enzyme|nr:hypothetical protein [Oscillospiraceae bacterium]